jgi:prepilin-type processing-associated H-X9-DG protein
MVVEESQFDMNLRQQRKLGFTLTELLLVIGMILLLIGLVLYGSQRIRKTARSLQCLNNERQIMSGWTSYATDNAGRYVAPDTDRHAWDWVSSAYPGPNTQYIAGTGFYEEKESALTQGRLFSYLGDIEVYKSPMDDTPKLRTYSLSAFLTDGEGAGQWGGPPSWRIGTVSRVPKPSETINVVSENDHRGHNINGWGIIANYANWIDKLGTFDEGYFNFAFVDGHTERYKYAGTSYSDPERIEEAFDRPQTDVYYPGPDYDWISKRLFPGNRALYGDW